MDQPVNGGAQHQPLIARFSAFHPFGGRLSSFSALIVHVVVVLAFPPISLSALTEIVDNEFFQKENNGHA
jgi:hypothetical protein